QAGRHRAGVSETDERRGQTLGTSAVSGTDAARACHVQYGDHRRWGDWTHLGSSDHGRDETMGLPEGSGPKHTAIARGMNLFNPRHLLEEGVTLRPRREPRHRMQWRPSGGGRRDG